MLDDFGRLVRNIRLTRRNLLFDMAEVFGISSAEMSAIECGDQPIPDWFIPALIRSYGLDSKTASSLRCYANKRKGANNDNKNAEGYPDPTAAAALKNCTDEYARFQKLLHTIFNICALSGFQLEGRIVLVDKRSGRVWR